MAKKKKVKRTRATKTKKKGKSMAAIGGDKVKEVAVRPKAGALTAEAVDNAMFDFGLGDINQDDVMIPKLLVMQGMSEFVTEGKAKFGDLVDSVTERVLGSLDAPVEFIPVKLEKLWRVEHKVGNKWMVKRVEPDVGDKREWTALDTEDGEEIRNVRSFNFYVVLPSDVAEGSALPLYLTFKSTSLQGGKKIVTQLMRTTKQGKHPSSTVFKLVPKKVSNDEGTFMVLDVSVERASSEVELAEAMSWASALKTKDHKVAEGAE